MTLNKIIKEGLNLLYWAMLAANTIGPGTVVTCARAGTEYELHLAWALLLASIFAYTLLEATARLTIVSGRSLGECLQVRYSNGRKVWHVGVFCWIVVICLFIGNTLYECNCFAGGMAAVYALPPGRNTVEIRVPICIGYACLVLIILFADKVDVLGVGLGVCCVAMAILFFVLVGQLGLDVARFFKGLVPMSMPSGSANVVLSLTGTTAVGFNLFLGGEMAKGKTLSEACRGIGFSTFMAFIISLFIVVVGDGTHAETHGKFTITTLGNIITRLSGKIGIWIFGIGFIASAFSSMLTTALAVALTTDSILSIKGTTALNGDVPQGKEVEANGGKEIGMFGSSSEDNILKEVVVRQLPKKYYNGLMCVMVLIAMCVVACDSPTVLVILIAQVFNGCLLPFFSICLLICINDDQFMYKSPQKGWSNCCLVTVVMVTLFLTGTTIIQNAFGWTVTSQYTTVETFQLCNFICSAVCAFVIMALVLRFTDLGKNIKRSFRIFFKRKSSNGFELSENGLQPNSVT